MEASFSLQSELGLALMRFAPPRGFAAHCTSHCIVFLAQDVREILKLASMKSESLVIANQQVAVNTFPGLVHTARQTMKVTNTRSPIRRPKVGGMIGAVCTRPGNVFTAAC